MENSIASMSLFAQELDSNPILITVKVGKPYQIFDEEWACALAIEPWHQEFNAAHGINSFQALSLATSLIINQLYEFKASRGKLFLDHHHEFPIEAFSLTLALLSGPNWFQQYSPN